ncbi:hypothetical protein Tco_0849577 [Tanacetum coccineum]
MPLRATSTIFSSTSSSYSIQLVRLEMLPCSELGSELTLLAGSELGIELTLLAGSELKSSELDTSELKTSEYRTILDGDISETLAEGTEGALHLGPERPRVYSDISPEDKERVDRIEDSVTMHGVQVQLVMGELRRELGMLIQVKQGRLSAKTAMENRVALDEEQLLFITGGQDNAVDEDVDEQLVQNLALNVDNVFQADDYDAFDSDFGWRLHGTRLCSRLIYHSHILFMMKPVRLMFRTLYLRKHDEIERKNILIAHDNLIADCLSKDVFCIATNSELTISRFTEMHDTYPIVQARCLELEAELSNLRDKVKKNDHIELVKRFSNLEVNHFNLQLKYQNLKESFGNNPPLPARVTPDFNSVFVIGKMKAFIQGKDSAIKKLKMQISQLKETRSEADRTLDLRALDFHITHLTERVTALQEQN